MRKSVNTLSLLVVSAVMMTTGLSSAYADKKNNNGKHKGHRGNNVRVVESVSRSSGPADNGAPVMAHSCPFSCATLSINKSHCRDWREGNTCFVQDTNARDVSYRILERPSDSRRYYTIEVPQLSPGEVIGDKIDREINRAIR